ncbi:hypothetical protein ACPOL_5540 [Acidisarcina polymorpha]|uniref:Uncharacterized protein n=1 Tax=Acidisarcina polymorpha TaxID=2211140 RepID=A0A2Z5G705_9BACT|nr:hypothetical protein ACPOL_5540 [Acidisarcina polymorpha]
MSIHNHETGLWLGIILQDTIASANGSRPCSPASTSAAPTFAQSRTFSLMALPCSANARGYFLPA